MDKQKYFKITYRLRACKNPKGLSGGDLFPDLVSANAEILAVPTDNLQQVPCRRQMVRHPSQIFSEIFPRKVQFTRLNRDRNEKMQAKKM